MKAILLAAGVGKRMGPDAPPKCLLPIERKTLLALTLESLRAVGVQEAALVVGYRKEEVVEAARAHAAQMELTLIDNPRYREGAILSLWAARGELTGDLILMDADVLCPLPAYERLIRSPHRNCLLVDGSSRDTGEEQMVFGEGGRVLAIAKRPSAQLKSRLAFFGESVGFLKLSGEAAGVLRELLKRKIDEGHVAIEHEQVYPELFEKVPVGYERIDELAWTEIDTPEDLRRAAEEILPRWSNPECLNRRMARAFLPWVSRLNISPNRWTTLSLIAGLAALGLIAQGHYRQGLWGAFWFQLFYLMDNWDGEIARIKGLSSRWGGWFDLWVDTIIQTGLPLALAGGLIRMGAAPWVRWLGWAAAGGLLLDFLITAWAKLKGFGPAIYGDPSRSKVALSDSGLRRALKANLTHENFSLFVAAVLVLDLRLAFLAAVAVGSQFFWIQFLLVERRRLFKA